jgi:hypothetical protein
MHSKERMQEVKGGAGGMIGRFTRRLEYRDARLVAMKEGLKL